MVEDRDRIDVINYELTDGTDHAFFAIPRLEEVQLSLSKREEEWKTNKLLQTKQLERESKAMYKFLCPLYQEGNESHETPIRIGRRNKLQT